MLSHEQFQTIRQLKDNPFFSKVLDMINAKYKKIGKYAGKVRFDGLTESERIFFSTIDRKMMEQSFAEFTVQQFFKKKVLTGILQEITIDEFFAIYNDHRIVTNSEINDAFITERNRFFQDIVQRFENTDGGNWLKYALENKTLGYTQIIKEYKRNADDLAETLDNVLRALNHYPKQKISPVPIFATEIAKNPHYFDYGSMPFGLLMNGFSFFAEKEYPSTIEDVQNLMLKFGLVKDLVSNQIATFHISAIKNGILHEGIEQFNAQGEVLSLTLKNINDYERMIVKNNVLYVFENPSVFSTIADKMVGHEISLVCTSGNIKLSAITLLDKVVADCDVIYYSGDLDPEGLKIADYLKQRYQEKLILWRMGGEDYIRSLSSVVLTDDRLRKLSSIKNELLQVVAEMMLSKKLAGYQEFLLAHYVEDIQMNLSRNDALLKYRRRLY